MSQLIQSEFWLGGSTPNWKSSWAWVFIAIWSQFCSMRDHYGAHDEGPAITQGMLFLGARQKPRGAGLSHKPILSLCLCHLCLYSIGQSQVMWPISTSAGRLVYSVHGGRRRGIHCWMKIQTMIYCRLIPASEPFYLLFCLHWMQFT